jgi:apolipoprotein N-acyltransferase
MTVFEYLMVMTSIVLAVALTQLLRGITEIWRSRRRYVPHLAWVVVLSFITAQIWWAFWDLNQVGDWTAFRFGFVLAVPIVVFLASAVLLPQRIPEDADWRDHFLARRREFMVLMTAYGRRQSGHSCCRVCSSAASGTIAGCPGYSSPA